MLAVHAAHAANLSFGSDNISIWLNLYRVRLELPRVLCNLALPIGMAIVLHVMRSVCPSMRFCVQRDKWIQSTFIFNFFFARFSRGRQNVSNDIYAQFFLFFPCSVSLATWNRARLDWNTNFHGLCSAYTVCDRCTPLHAAKPKRMNAIETKYCPHVLDFQFEYTESRQKWEKNGKHTAHVYIYI